MKTTHFICKVYDTLNDKDNLVSVYCDVTTPNKAKKYFLSHPTIKKFIGNHRYIISFRANPVLLQDRL